MRKKKTKMSITEVRSQTAKVLRDLYDLNVITREEVETDAGYDHYGRKVFTLKIVGTEKKVRICSQMFSGLLDNNVSITREIWKENGKEERLVCHIFYE